MDVASFMSRYEAILKERKIPKMKFYQDCGFTDAAVSQWRRKKNIPSTKNIQTIADYLSVSYEYLVTGVEAQKEQPAPPSGSELSDLDYIMSRLPSMSKEDLARLAEALPRMLLER